MNVPTQSRPIFSRFPRAKHISFRIVSVVLVLFVFGVGLLNGALLMEEPVTTNNLKQFLEQFTGSEIPGLQYIVVKSDQTLFKYAGGWADIQNQTAMTLDTTMMAFSMTKTITAVAVLQLASQGKIALDDAIDLYFPDQPYRGHHITIRQLLTHTAGLPNPVPLRWVHLSENDADFHEESELAQVLQDNSEMSSTPGNKYSYSNIGYWLLGRIIEKVSGQKYVAYVNTNIILPLGISSREMGFAIPDPSKHAKGYLAKYSIMNLVKRFVLDAKIWADYEESWLRIKNLYLNGPAFGGLVGTARGFSIFLQDQLRTESILLGAEEKILMETRQTVDTGDPIPMTLGWNLGKADGTNYLFKEGGGGGFHCEMRIYPLHRIASVVMVNATQFNSTKFLNRADHAFLSP